MKLISCDQSLSKFGYIIWNDNIPISKNVIRTGQSSCIKKIANVNYFNTIIEQIIFIVEEFIKIVKIENPNFICLEGLAFDATGNQTRNLAGIYFCLLYKLKELGYSETNNLFIISPTSNKSYAKTLLPDKTKVKMNKKLMISLAESKWPGILEGYKSSGVHAGKEDLADALHLGRYVYDHIINKL